MSSVDFLPAILHNMSITSELAYENNGVRQKTKDGVITRFFFRYPPYMIDRTGSKVATHDDDGDLIIDYEREGTLVIEHSENTNLKLVGLQVWRGALLLADYILSSPKLFEKKRVLEVGSGVGLTSIVASFLADEVLCSDVNLQGILKLIEKNFKSNSEYVKGKYRILEVDFFKENWSKYLLDKVINVDVILAADVVYDDLITEGFVRTLDKLFHLNPEAVAYVALEKRYVFTVEDCEPSAPMYEEFKRIIKRLRMKWNIEHLDLKFPQYFAYKRVKEMVLMKISKKVHSCQIPPIFANYICDCLNPPNLVSMVQQDKTELNSINNI